jgi:hypothetical protein
MLELLQEVGCDLKGKARFAATSSASEGEQPGSHEQPSDRSHLAFAANKPVHLERQIVRRGVEVLRHCSIFHGMPSSSYSALDRERDALLYRLHITIANHEAQPR